MISEKFLMKRVKEWAASPEGKKVIKEKTGLDYDPKLDVGNFATTVANDMKAILFKHIQSDGNRNAGYPAVIDSMKLSDIIVGRFYVDENGKAKIDVVFDEDKLHRDSLIPDEYDGIDNIVLLHMTGAHTNGAVFGYWMGHGWVKSVTDRAPNDFMQRAVAEFNEKYNGKAYAELQGKYKI